MARRGRKEEQKGRQLLDLTVIPTLDISKHSSLEQDVNVNLSYQRCLSLSLSLSLSHLIERCGYEQAARDKVASEVKPGGGVALERLRLVVNRNTC